MARPIDEGIELARLARDVRAADPEAFVVPSRIVRRVIREDRRLTGFVLQVPHRKSYVARREPLLDYVLPSELGLDSEDEIPDRVILLAAPNPDKLEVMPPEQARMRAWRLLFHARVHADLDDKIARGELTAAQIRERVDRIGQTQFDEIRAVLKHEDLILPPPNETAVWVEFAALFLELRYFAPDLLSYYFPAIADLSAAEQVISEDVDARALRKRTQVPGASLPSSPDDLTSLSEREEPPPPLPEVEPSEERAQRIGRTAKKASNVGNSVRAAILFRVACQPASEDLAHRLASRARQELDTLAARLRAALSLDRPTMKRWRAALDDLLDLSVHGFVAPEARLLYDLQKTCVDHERGVYTVDLVEWALTLGKRPIVRDLPSQRDVLMARHLRGAMSRLPSTRLQAEVRSELSSLLQDAVKSSELRMRNTFRPRIQDALREVDLEPRNLPERTARDKIVEELLDRMIERKHLRMGDLRDALSRNALKLPDCSGWRDFWNRDSLLRLDRRLSASLDGVYRRGEFYLRWLQRTSAVTFGTAPGRWLTRFVFIPLGGAFLVLEGLQHTLGVGIDKLFGVLPQFREPFQIPLLVLAVFLLGVIHHAGFRKSVVNGLRALWTGIRTAFWDVPVKVLGLPAVARILASRPILLLWRLVLKPLMYTGLIWTYLSTAWEGWDPSIVDGVTLFLIMNLLLSSPVGRQAEEVGVDWVSLNWHRVRVRIILGLFRWIVSAFKSLVETLDRVLYTVDEWLRFQRGETLFSKINKAVLGTVWFFVSYLFRLYINLLVEPQVNPIKHFPVVTVSHKIILPLTVVLTNLLAAPLKPVIGTVAANAIAGTTVVLLPGVFGFLVWELKENWRLFRANRPSIVKPVIVGSHGETVLRLMKPGFHSGTLPKLFRKLRKAGRNAVATGRWKVTRKIVEKLHHVDESVHRFVERELLQIVHESRCLGEARCHIAEVKLGSNSVRIAIGCPDVAPDILRIAFEEQSGWLLASLHAPGWLTSLDPKKLDAMRNALVGFYKTAGAELVRLQVESALGDPPPAYDIADEGLVIWPEADFETEILYPLDDAPIFVPTVTRGTPPQPLLPIDRERLLFKETPLTWADWVAAWEEARLTPPARLVDTVKLMRVSAR